jgi:hypothetical protein
MFLLFFHFTRGKERGRAHKGSQERDEGRSELEVTGAEGQREERT